MTKNKTIKETMDQNKILVIKTVEKEKPENTSQLISLIQKRHRLSEQQTIKLLIELEDEGKLHFTRKETPLPLTRRSYLLSLEASWYWVIMILAAATTATVFTIPENAYPTVYLRYALGMVFVLCLPGYAFIKTLFPSKAPMITSSENIDNTERVPLSIGMSIALVAIVGLIMNYTPWGIRLTPVTLSLLALTVVLATTAFLRECHKQTPKIK